MTLNIYESQLEKMRSLPNRFQIRAVARGKFPEEKDLWFTEPVSFKLCSLIIFDQHLKINKARNLVCENTIPEETMTAPSNDITPHL